MTSPLSRFGAALAIVVTATLVSACAPSDDPAPEQSISTPPTASAPAPEPSTTETTEPAAEEPTCETIIPETTVADFESIGWTVQSDRFLIGELDLAGGIICTWADFSAPAGDHLQFYGWAPISDEDAEFAQESLVSGGWIREDSPDGVYITENPDTTIAVDDEGYGMTYLFVDGGVELADTKQGLLLVEWPPVA